MNLLILDDEWYAVKGLSEGVAWPKEDVDEVFEAFSAAQARQIVLERDIGVVICDIEMPEENGLLFAKWLARERPQVQVIFLTGHADFDYAQQALKTNAADYILKPADHGAIVACVHKAVERARDEARIESYAERWQEHASRMSREQPERIRLFWRSVVDNRLSLEEIRGRMGSLDIQLPAPGLVLPVAVWLEDYVQIMSSGDEEVAAFLVGERLDNGILGRLGGCRIPMEDMDALLLIYQAPEDLPRQLSLEMARIGSQVGCRIAWRAGEPALPDRLWWSIYRMKNQLADRGELPTSPAPIDWEALFIRRAVDQLHKQADQLIASANGGDVRVRVRSLYHKFYGAALSLRDQCGLSQRTVDLIDDDGSATASPERLADWMHKVIDACVQDIGAVLSSRDATVEHICRYVLANLDKELSRAGIAAEVNLHPVYLARIFKQEMAMTLGDYITAARIRAAQDMLKDPSVKISGVGQRVGYPQISYFSRVFRKIVGMSPQEYQRECAQEGQG